jgi:DNA polymerase-3 subunit epsilon
MIENGIYKGFAFYDLNYQINNVEILRNIIIPMQNNRDTKHHSRSCTKKQNAKNNKILKSNLICSYSSCMQLLIIPVVF